MIAVTPQTRVLVCVTAVDFRNGIDGLAAVCRATLANDPFSGTMFVFRNRRGTAIKILAYDGQGFWLCQKRLSEGKFRHWPSATASGHPELLAHQLHVLLAGGDAATASGAPTWRPIDAPTSP